ncbi:MAG: diguanylate cyclase [Myxococcota bacterium]
MQLSTQVAIAISLVVAAAGAGATGIALESQDRERRSAFVQTSRESVQLLALSVAPAVAEGHHERVQAVLDNISNFRERFPDVHSLEVVDRAGVVVASLDPRRYNLRGRPVELKDSVVGDPESITLYVPLRLKHPLGVIEARFSVQRLNSSLERQKVGAAALVAATMLLVGAGLFFLHQRLVSKRLSRLAKAASAVGEGDLSVRAEDGGNDEIAALGQTFNTMAAAIRLHTEDLEQLIASRTRELEEANERLEQLATTDQLTGVWNRRYFDEAARRSIALARRSSRPLSVVLVDTDRFKSINDTYGHGVGDQVLQRVATLLRDNARQADLVARVGGEEFAILMPDAELDLAAQAAERMRGALEREVGSRVTSLEGRTVTASFGVASLEYERDNLDELLSRADRAMYRSKEAGRNQVTTGTPFDDTAKFERYDSGSP